MLICKLFPITPDWKPLKGNSPEEEPCNGVYWLKTGDWRKRSNKTWLEKFLKSIPSAIFQQHLPQTMTFDKQYKNFLMESVKGKHYGQCLF